MAALVSDSPKIFYTNLLESCRSDPPRTLNDKTNEVRINEKNKK